MLCLSTHAESCRHVGAMAHLSLLGHSPACLDRASFRALSAKPLVSAQRPKERHSSHRLQAQNRDQGPGSASLQQLADKCRAAVSELPLAVRGATAAALVSAALLTGTQPQPVCCYSCDNF